jgi:hypothetical protein
LPADFGKTYGKSDPGWIGPGRCLFQPELRSQLDSSKDNCEDQYANYAP